MDLIAFDVLSEFDLLDHGLVVVKGTDWVLDQRFSTLFDLFEKFPPAPEASEVRFESDRVEGQAKIDNLPLCSAYGKVGDELEDLNPAWLHTPTLEVSEGWTGDRGYCSIPLRTRL